MTALPRARTYIRELHFTQRHLITKEIYGVYLDRYVRTEDRWWFASHEWHTLGARAAPDLSQCARGSGRARRLARLMRLHDHLDYLSSAEPEAEFRGDGQSIDHPCRSRSGGRPSRGGVPGERAPTR